MTLTIELPPEVEAQLREEAASNGIDAGTFVVRALEEQLLRKKHQKTPPHLSQDETKLLEKINQGLPEAIWHEYHDLISKRQKGLLSSEEQSRLISLSDSIEEAHTEKIACVAELAIRRHIPLNSLMKQLGIKPRKV